MRALLFERSLPRFAAAKLASAVAAGRGARVGPLRLAEVEPPALPGPGWHRLTPRLAGICGSDLATVDARSSRWFEPIVSFPFVPGHEVVGDLEDGRRVVLEPVLSCAARNIVPPCPGCARGDNGCCERIAFGCLQPGLQTGYCADTGGGWSAALVAHESQLHEVPEDTSDEAAVMVEPAACAVHAVQAAAITDTDTVVVLGAGTLGLCTVAAVRHLASPGAVIASAKHPEQRRLAVELGAGAVAAPSEVRRAVRRQTRSLAMDGRLTGGADIVIDCVGSESSLADALAVVRPRGTVVLVGMPGPVNVDLTPLWQREIRLVGSYAYRHSTFATAFELVASAKLERLVSAVYPLEEWRDALDHAVHSGPRGAVKIAFDLRLRPPRKAVSTS
ncbi:MAG TPA: zinc-binding dehydrogenase [Acidimicrobiales bacterium]|nr:zinc-binding dehydrogenase [Acidimicrobiales bacterium]